MLSPQNISENIYKECVRYPDLYWRHIPGLDEHSYYPIGTQNLLGVGSRFYANNCSNEHIITSIIREKQAKYKMP